jgi:hypothetical protein
VVLRQLLAPSSLERRGVFEKKKKKMLPHQEVQLEASNRKKSVPLGGLAQLTSGVFISGLIYFVLVAWTRIPTTKQK